MFALIAAALIVIIVSTVLRDEPTLTNGPQIIGPNELLVGNTGTWRHENRAGVAYEWTLPSGETSSDLVVEWTPTNATAFIIRLSATGTSSTTSSEMSVTVRTP